MVQIRRSKVARTSSGDAKKSKEELPGSPIGLRRSKEFQGKARKPKEDRGNSNRRETSRRSKIILDVSGFFGNLWKFESSEDVRLSPRNTERIQVCPI